MRTFQLRRVFNGVGEYLSQNTTPRRMTDTVQNLKNIEGREFVVVQDGDDSAGATVWWRLRGDCDRAALSAALESAHLGYRTPAPHSPEIALRRAISVLRGKRRLIRPLRRGAWAVVEEQ